MRLVRLTESSIQELFNSFPATDLVTDLIKNVVKGMAMSYTNFVHTTLTLHSGSYVKANSPDSPVSGVDMVTIINQLRTVVPDLSEDNILVADKMDVLYGTDYRTYCEYSKFSLYFYEHVHEVILERMTALGQLAFLEDAFDTTVKGIEYIVAMIEQLVVFSNFDVDLDDMIILCLVHRPDSLFFVML